MKTKGFMVLVTVMVVLSMALLGCPNGDDGGGGDGTGEDWANPVNGVITADVLIIGAGGSGLTAANVLVREGKKVLVIEQNATAGGATATIGGAMNGSMSAIQKAAGINDTLQATYEDLLFGGQNNDPRMLTLYVNNNGPSIDYVHGLGVPFLPTPTYIVDYRYDRMLWAEGNGPGVIAALQKAFTDEGGQLRISARAMELILEGEAVTGAKVACAAEGELTIYADNVIIATGGYGNNRDLLTQYAPSLLPVLFYGPLTACQGDGFIMATRDAGAMMWFMEEGKVYPNGVEYPEPGLGRIWSGRSSRAFDLGAILITKDGVRVVSEEASMIDHKYATLAAPDAVLYLLMDAANWEQHRPSGSTSLPNIPQTQIDAWIAAPNNTFPPIINGTIAEIEQAFELTNGELQATVDAYNKAIADGASDCGFGRDFSGLTAAEKEDLTIGDGPYYLMEQKTRFATTLGGLKVDNEMRVLRQSGSSEVPILGLFAAGEVIGGVHGKESMPSANMGWAFTSGRLVGLSVSGRVNEIVTTPIPGIVYP